MMHVITLSDVYSRSRGVRSVRPIFETTESGLVKCLACGTLIGRTQAAVEMHQHSQGHVENLMRYVCEAK